MSVASTTFKVFLTGSEKGVKLKYLFQMKIHGEQSHTWLLQIDFGAAQFERSLHEEQFKQASMH
ncbi:hypothetical protein BPOR_0144g00150 [Botrytis porri]|uniref:Uncharacterized protein n=1 Tax=Botrytis porri TaxID=87229 RepID=A0A4Z1KW49_9HELO|nr:hypothetical protein BPOR_0144g00150 [Botrytis porri]